MIDLYLKSIRRVLGLLLSTKSEIETPKESRISPQLHNLSNATGLSGGRKVFWKQGFSKRMTSLLSRDFIVRVFLEHKSKRTDDLRFSLSSKKINISFHIYLRALWKKREKNRFLDFRPPNLNFACFWRHLLLHVFKCVLNRLH